MTRTPLVALLWLATAGLAAAQPAPSRPDPAPAPAAAAQAFTPAQREEIVEVLRDALGRDPSILREAITALRQADEADRARGRRDAIANNAEALFRNAGDPSKGNPRGSLTIVEFFDARCTYCRALQPAMAELLRRDRDLRVVLKDIPILGPNSVLASRALFASQRQNKYEPFYDALLALRTDVTEATLQAEAQRVGLDWPRLRRDMDDPAIQTRINDNLRLAQSLGIEGTPALVIGTTLVPGAVDLDTLQRLVAEARRG
ncbi:DsbA family protein [Roseomonas sp. BN140053]|uniref:DsbA family protein n=1 Tax=Roseomonas sp. BN140053 TaxID=3391898 RepID=UPI0039EB0DB3